MKSALLILLTTFTLSKADRLDWTSFFIKTEVNKVNNTQNITHQPESYLGYLGAEFFMFENRLTSSVAIGGNHKSYRENNFEFDFHSDSCP
jgi:hypothetical protein